MLNFLFTHTPLTFLTQSLWRDEAFSYLLAKKNILQIITLSAKDFNPPLYYILLHLWIKIFGVTEISLRIFSFIFYWAILYVCAHFLQDIFKLNLKKSLLYFILFIFNPILSYYAFEARAYTLFAFLATLSYYSFYKRSFKLYLVATILGLYTHYFMLFVVFSQFIFIYLTQKGRRDYKNIKKVIIKTLIAFLPWVVFVFSQGQLFTSSFWVNRPNLKTFINLPATIFTGYESSVILTSLILLVFFVLSLKIAKKQNVGEGRHLFLYLFLWSIGIPMFVALISFVKPIFLPRYLLFSTVGFILLLIYIMERLNKLISLIMLILLFLISFNFQKNQIQLGKKADLRKKVREIKVLAKKDDLLYVTSELDFFIAQYYFNENKVYIYNKSYKEIPNFVGKVLIPKEKIASSLPFYPKKAFLLRSNGSYDIQALY